ncbi:hypothetical protein RAZWK3B_20671 [Roseobacter sp. AzwK-3b]|nr:hypothetical protein RAZWK3B_20671 [Roseobacter sp. AzwK-3b]
MLRVLLVDLYVRWLHDPTLATGFSKNKNDYQVNSRYNKVFISPKIIQVEKLLEDEDYIDSLPGYNDRTGKGDNYTTRIRPSEKLRNEFEQISATLYDIDYHVGRQLIILRERYEDETERVHKRNIEYIDTDYTNRIREQLEAYNELLKQTFIDIPSLEEPFVRRIIETGKRAGQEIKISIGPENKHVHRVFNGTEDDNWSKGGRFYGGWWLQIPKELRKDIYINDQPTVEIDFKAMHPNMLMETSAADPYRLDRLVLPDLIPNVQQQRDAVKSLILMAINANNANGAFAAFRNAHKRGDPLKKLTNEQLQILLDAFTDQYPEMREALNTGKALHLMNLDSQIANLVIDYFTQQGIPVLCIHDSFIIQDDNQQELRKALDLASQQIIHKGIDQDTKSNGSEIPTVIQGNIKGYRTGRNAKIKIPNKVKPTEQYELRKMKYYKWLEHSKEYKR